MVRLIDAPCFARLVRGREGEESQQEAEREGKPTTHRVRGR